MIEVGDIVRFVNWEEHPYGKLLLKDMDTARYEVVGERVQAKDIFGRTLKLMDISTGELKGDMDSGLWYYDGWLVKDEFLTAVRRASRLDPDVPEVKA